MLSVADIDALIKQHEREFAEFKCEVETIHREVVSLHYPQPTTWRTAYGFQHTCHAYTMGVFSRIDAVSMFWAGGENWTTPTLNRKDQTKRMVAFMDKYHSRQNQLHLASVQLWRHTLMHEGGPRELVHVSGQHYRWHLVWDIAASDHHSLTTMQPAETGEPFTLHVVRHGLLRLVGDYGRMLGTYFDDLRLMPSLRQHYENRVKEIEQETFPRGKRPTPCP